MSASTVYLGHVCHLTGNPSLEGAPDALEILPDGFLHVDAAGKIVEVGAARGMDELPACGRVEDWRGSWILPGFIDLHVHFPQVWARNHHAGGRLLNWLERAVFPAEERLEDPAIAGRAVRDFLDSLISSGTTCAMIFGSQFPAAQELLFEGIAQRGLRAVVGRTTMVMGPPSAQKLLTTEQEALRLCEEEIERWHPPAGEAEAALVHVALMPRYALSMTRPALRSFGELYERYRGRGVYFSTHLSENDDGELGEVQRVRAEYGVRDYLDVYDGRFLPGSARGGPSFLGPRSIFAHCVHCTNDEYDRLALSASSVAHCPSSQLFLGSGTMPLGALLDRGLRVGLGSDVAAGTSFSLADVARDAYCQHVGAEPTRALRGSELLHLMTLGGAQALRRETTIGNFDPGKEADFVIVDPARTPPLKRLLDGPELQKASLEQRLFASILGMGQGSVAACFVRGRHLR